jgi:hypothetical protein
MLQPESGPAKAFGQHSDMDFCAVVVQQSVCSPWANAGIYQRHSPGCGTRAQTSGWSGVSAQTAGWPCRRTMAAPGSGGSAAACSAPCKRYAQRNQTVKAFCSKGTVSRHQAELRKMPDAIAQATALLLSIMCKSIGSADVAFGHDTELMHEDQQIGRTACRPAGRCQSTRPPR